MMSAQKVTNYSVPVIFEPPCIYVRMYALCMYVYMYVCNVYMYVLCRYVRIYACIYIYIMYVFSYEFHFGVTWSRL